MAGGHRPGGGAKPGEAKAATRALVKKILEDGQITPVEYLVHGMRTAIIIGDHPTAFQYAEAAAPFLHPKLQAIELGNDDSNPIPIKIVVSPSDIAAALKRFNESY